MTEMSITKLMNSLVPITRFNRGEADKIFDEVNENGTKIVLKNNTPACILVKPSHYEEMIEALEDYTLYFEAEKRMAVSSGNYISSEKLFSDMDISESDLDKVEVDIE